MPDSAAPAVADPVDPDIRRFVDAVSRDFARHGPLEALPPAQVRAIAEEVRRPWREGGPKMAETRDLKIPVGEGVRARIHYPQVPTPGPCAALLYLHGGGWTIFSIDTHDRLMREYASRSGLVVIGIDYALSPEAKFPEALDQVVGVVRWLKAEGPGLGVDPERLFLGGDSAGGNLSICSALRLRDEGDGKGVKGLVLNYAVLADACSEEAARRFGGEGFMLGADEMDSYWDNYLARREDAQSPYAVPMRAALEGLPPVFMAVAECDVLAEQSYRMDERLRSAGVKSEMHVYHGATHSFLEAVSISPLAARALGDASLWLERAAGGVYQK